MTGMHLALDLSFSHTEGRWAIPGSFVGREFPDVRAYMELAQMADRGGVDLLFFGDGSGIPSTWQGSRDGAVEWGVQWPRHDMSPVIAAMSTVTERVGFGLTYSSTFMHPFYVARLLNSLDHVTSGRIAFNVVASTRLADAQNYGYDQLLEHELRYERMEEFIGVCKALWRSVEPDAILRDRETRRFADPTKVHPIDHHGRFFDVAGPLASVPSPQIEPVLVQAGASPRGIQASASFADLVFGFGTSLAGMQRHRSLLDEQLTAQGRDAQAVGILWDLQAVIGATEEEAQNRKQTILDAWTPEMVAVSLSHNSGYDFSTLPDKFRLGDLRESIVAAQASPAGLVGTLVQELGEDHLITNEDFFSHGWAAATGVDHMLVGSATAIADELEETFAATGSRGGFMISSPSAFPSGFAAVVELLIPELERRGAMAERAPGPQTLRQTLCA
ncbi:NtaA/DmoA family FMN-dependent monooxygenase [Aeromicrobium sp. SMF47]|uniref:NtaA/DmoA family FMN-dependent monooxygenase n=1 Tax=Aeromicrobium yanjiei TaxID=2662028 RepID=UPI00129D9223|nr:NtaA/DmoA family FMN-dependent monooxygenase [Aeromicrobium yanjiei]MRJ77880.1 NtaA/DmoA family FMN-dependent monooxygenase [Aeromicrobium yanjiei]